MDGKLDWGREIEPALATCLGCRACETACPSDVKFGEILEYARARLESSDPHRLRRAMAGTFTSAKVLRSQMALSKLWPGKRVPPFVSFALAGRAAEANIPKPQAPFAWPALDESSLPAVRGRVYLPEGCVMSVLFPRVNEATRRLLRRVGFEVEPVDAGCCGALHAHLGYLDEADRMAAASAAAFSKDLPIVINAAGCGSTMKEYGAHAPELQSVSDRVRDVSEFLLAEGLEEVLARDARFELKATYHDACHLAHGQGVRDEPRRLLSAIPGLELVPLEESDMCCGSAGIYNLTQPGIARQLLDRKWANVEQTGAAAVILGNPGCHAWLEQAAMEHGGQVRVFHTVEVLEFALTGNCALGS
jgi:glycolate oxidase iron-sulfur subunit